MGEAVTFLLIAVRETRDTGLSVTEVSKLGGFALSSASRYVQNLGVQDRHKRPGLELVSDNVDMMERRRKILRITAKGQATVEDVAAAANS